MKVCTDACILGSYTADFIASLRKEPLNCIDIGTGTGLLSLMLAQKLNISIDAVEIDPDACQQAEQNFALSPFAARLKVVPANIKTLAPASTYDLIICNPPFYENDLLSPLIKNNTAKHAAKLSFSELLSYVEKHLFVNGYFCVLLPYQRMSEFKNMAQGHSLFLVNQLLIKNTENSNYFRAVLIFNKSLGTIIEKELVIRKNDKEYTTEFISLLKDYYLKL